MYRTTEHALHPSILNADYLQMGAELERIHTADAVHVDVMDNHFVPNLTFGPTMVEHISQHSALPVDAHLMIDRADTEAIAYAEAGADSVTFHVEAAQAPIRLARELRRAGAKVGIGLRPTTPVEPLLDVLGEFDLLLVMTVEPGFGGQKFLESMLHKVRRTRQRISESNLEVSIQVDGGVNRETIQMCAEAGANVFVAGSAVFGAEDASSEIESLRELAGAHAH